MQRKQILLDFMQCLKYISLCKYLFTRKRENQAYLLYMYVESKKIPVYCQMEAAELVTCGGGGWTLVMKIDGKR